MNRLEFHFIFNEVKYIARGIAWSKNNNAYLNIGHAGDEFPCIMIEFDRVKGVCKLSKLRAQKFGGWKEDNRIVCLQPAIPKSGALDILVLLSLSIIRKYIGKVITYINDGAMVDNQYPLSWKKFWLGKGTTYSKYGFRFRFPELRSSKLREPELKEPKLKSGVPDFFKQYMKQVRRELNKNPSLEAYIKNIFDKRLVSKYNPEFTNPKAKAIDIRGIWYLDWNYYENLSNKIEVSLTIY
jgi:hypothetical protein